jgi:regulator of protease activity HflC (stomatin/prohibitin superfamily)
LYPFDPQTVFAAVHAQGVSPGQEGKPEELGWERIVIDKAAALVRDTIARMLLDHLLENNQEGEKPPREALRDEVKNELAKAIKSYGIQVMGIGLGNIEVEDEEVLKQRAESWKAGWERRRLEIEAQGEAEAIRLIEEARTDAQRQMIAALTDAFQQLEDAGTPVPAHVIALRFIDVLESVTTSPPVQGLLPENVEELPARLRLLVAQSAAGQQGTEQPKGSR